MFTRHPANPIVRPGGAWFRRAVTFNPAVIRENGKFYLFERTAGQLRPFHCYIGLQTSEDGVHFTSHGDEPIFTPAMAGSEYGSVQDPRIVKLEGRYYLSFAYRPYAWASNPTGVGVPESHQVDYPGFSGDDADNQTRSGLAVSDNLIDWEFHGWVTPKEIDDRNVIPFPEKIGGKYWTLRRPSSFVGTAANHSNAPQGVMISHSDDLLTWSDPELLFPAALSWEDNRIGGSTPPIRTERGWLVFYHGVQTLDADTRHVCYRMGAVLLDLNDPTKVLSRAQEPLLEPTEYYEKHGVYIPDVVFPTSALVIDGEIWLYYGVCDTAIALATARLEDVMARL